MIASSVVQNQLDFFEHSTNPGLEMICTHDTPQLLLSAQLLPPTYLELPVTRSRRNLHSEPGSIFLLCGLDYWSVRNLHSESGSFSLLSGLSHWPVLA